MKVEGTASFAYGVHLHQPDPIRANETRRMLSDSTRASQIGSDLKSASVGLGTPSIDNLKPSKT